MDTRRFILEATERLMRSKGLARLTTKMIAQEAGVSEGTLFNQFGKKDDLVLAVVLERVPQMFAAFGVPGEASVEANLVKISHGIIGFYGGVLPNILSLFGDAELLAKHQEAVRHRGGGPQFLMDKVVGYLDAERKLGRVAGGVNLRSAASLLVGACFQWVFVQQSTGTKLYATMSDNKFIDDLIATLCAGLTPRSEANKPVAAPRAKAAPRKRTKA